MKKINYLDTIKSPVITEKSTILQESGKYTFKVSNDANKSSVKKAIEELFEVKVVAVNIILKKGKPKTFGRNRIITPSYKKAIVLKKDFKAAIAELGRTMILKGDYKEGLHKLREGNGCIIFDHNLHTMRAYS